MTIRPAQPEDLRDIAAIEGMVEDPRLAASIEVLETRLRLFPEGFLVALSNETIVGYLESIRWNGPPFERFSEISDYPRMHQEFGCVLYVSFLAVHPAHQKHGIGSCLLHAVLTLAAGLRLEKVQLVSVPRLVSFYEKRGFRRIRTLPHFLDTSGGELLERDLTAE